LRSFLCMLDFTNYFWDQWIFIRRWCWRRARAIIKYWTLNLGELDHIRKKTCTFCWRIHWWRTTGCITRIWCSIICQSANRSTRSTPGIRLPYNERRGRHSIILRLLLKCILFTIRSPGIVSLPFWKLQITS
jgi:hypothetical protein